jgi:hypothetical protein
MAISDIFDGNYYDDSSGQSGFDIALAIFECQDAGGRLSSLVDLLPNGALIRACQKLYGDQAEAYAAALRLLMT